MNGDKLNQYLKISVIILNLFIVNVYTVLFSILTVGILTPALVGASYSEMEKILSYDMIGIHKRYFSSIKENIKNTLGKIIIIQIFIYIIIISLLFLDGLVAENYSLSFYYFIVSAQIFLLFEAFNIVQITLIQLFVHGNKNIQETLKYSFLILNTNFFRFVLADISIVITVVLMTKLPIFALIFISLSLLLYYISVKQTTIEFYEKIKEL